MKWKHLAWILFFIAFFFILLPRAKAQEAVIAEITPVKVSPCYLRSLTLVKVAEAKPEEEAACIFGVKDGEEGWYAIVFESSHSEQPLVIIHVTGDVQTIVWHKPII